MAAAADDNSPMPKELTAIKYNDGKVCCDSIIPTIAVMTSINTTLGFVISSKSFNKREA
jgi:hypothetical protein